MMGVGGCFFLPQGDGLGALFEHGIPGVIKARQHLDVGEVRDVLAHVVVQADEAPLDELHGGDRGDDLGHGGGPADRVLGEGGAVIFGCELPDGIRVECLACCDEKLGRVYNDGPRMGGDIHDAPFLPLTMNAAARRGSGVDPTVVYFVRISSRRDVLVGMVVLYETRYASLKCVLCMLCRV